MIFDILQEYSPDSSFNVSVNDETVDLISRVADLQQEKWQLEERVRILLCFVSIIFPSAQIYKATVLEVCLRKFCPCPLHNCLQGGS